MKEYYFKDDSIVLLFRLETIQPDRRQWKPSNPLIWSGHSYGIKIPLKPEYVVNFEEIASAQINNTDAPEVVLTPSALRFCIDQFEAVMSEKKETKNNDDNEEWEKVEDEWEHD